ncbi:Papain family cysteine protease [Salegentibacter holothuriorum]|uniref:Papain family cysteine protease n=1 Tax=Salegentibacter holothuriorum TaxID=241145 RepID=A0A1T5EDC3_9FLAO|nr:C1 family peptidase [Salegentibacter holothuriorum]SKB81705.1 Papain family cysteine protease [Salegentibacter holothuriorum]
MKKLQLLIFALILSLTGCYNDRDDLDPSGNNNSPEVPQETDNQFVAEDGEIYFTGLDCTGNGNYILDSENLLEDLSIPNTLPETFDLSKFLPPVGNQGDLGSCTSWATSYYMKSFQEKIESGLPYSEATIFSPSYTYNQLTSNDCGGTSIQETLALIEEQGVAALELFPYTENECTTQPNETITEAAEEARIADYKALSGENMVAEMKTLLTQQQPIIIGAVLSPEFGKTDSFGLTAYREHNVNYEDVTCHAMLVVGFNDEFNAFKLVNSWGESWGDNGFVWIDYQAFENVADTNASFRVINQAYVAYDL